MIRASLKRSTLSPVDAGVLAHMRPTDFNRLSAASSLVECARNTPPLKGFDVEKTIIVVGDGILALQSTLSDGRLSLTELFQANDILDLRRITRRFQGDVVCLSRSRLCVLNSHILDEIAQSDETVYEAIQERLREQMHSLRDHCLDIGMKTPVERVASFIFEQSKRVPTVKVGQGHLTVPLSKREIAQYLALRPETVSRAFSALDCEGVISVSKRRVLRVLDIVALRQIANGSMPRGSSSIANRIDAAC